MHINNMNAYRYNDNYQIVGANDCCVGVEHNESEAQAIAKYLTGYHGIKHSVKRNSINDVKKARLIRRDCVRVSQRNDIFKEMNII